MQQRDRYRNPIKLYTDILVKGFANGANPVLKNEASEELVSAMVPPSIKSYIITFSYKSIAVDLLHNLRMSIRGFFLQGSVFLSRIPGFSFQL